MIADLPRAFRDVRVRALATIALGTLCLLLPALVNGFPFVYPDTGTYLSSAFRGTIPIDRPAWYGLFMRIGSLGGHSYWGIVYAQSLLCSVYIFRTVALLVEQNRHAVTLAITFLLGAASSIGWFAGLLLPDIFTGFGLLALLQALMGNGGPWRRGADTVMAVFCCWVHLSNLLIIPLSGALLLFAGRRYPPSQSSGSRWSGLVAGTLLAWGSLAVANRVVDREFYISRGGQAFLVARMLDTGMLRAWMEEHCADGDYRICAYKDRLPPTGGHLLWHDSISPMHLEGGWLATKPEYDRIVRSTLTEPRYLWWHLTSGLASTAELFTKWTICGALTNPEYRRPGSPPYDMIEGTIRSGLGPYLTSMQNGGRGELDMTWPDRVNATLLLVCLGLALFLMLRRQPVYQGPTDRALLIYASGAVLIDALICSSLSATEDRYLSRVSWLLPLFVLTIIARHLRRTQGQQTAMPTSNA